METFRNLSIKWKLTWIIMLASATPLVLCCLAFIGYEVVTYQDAMLREYSSQAEIIAANNTGNLSFIALGIDTKDDAEQTLNALRGNENVVAAGIYTNDGEVFAKYVREGNSEIFPVNPTSNSHRFTESNLVLFKPVIQDADTLGKVYIKSDLGVIYGRVKQYGTIAISFLLGAFIVAFVLASVLQRVISGPILQLADTMKKVTEGKDYSLRAAQQWNDEVGYLFDGFNDMLTQIEKRDEELEDYSNNLAEKVAFRTQELNEKNKRQEEMLLQMKEMQNQIIMQEKLASLGTLTAGIAHEIKNPLNFVNNFARLSVRITKVLRDFFDKEKEKFELDTVQEIQKNIDFLELNVQKINEHGKRADSIIRNMLLHSRGKPGERQQIDLNALLDEYVTLAYHGMRAKDTSFNIAIKKEYDDAVGMVEAVPQDLSRVFLNILSNACYATHEKMKTANGDFSPTLNVITKNGDNDIEIYVRDNGKGIPEDHLDKIFNPFFTTKPTGDGTGLGLSISYDIILQHKGDIRVKTEEGNFTEFVIQLPKDAENAVLKST